MKHKSYYKEVEKKLNQAGREALEEIGLDLIRFATLIITANGNIDTGRLRASISAVVEDKTFENEQYLSAGKSEDKPRGNAGKLSLQYGTNVHYGVWIEKRFPFIKPAFLMNKPVYQKRLDEKYQEVLNEHQRP